MKLFFPYSFKIVHLFADFALSASSIRISIFFCVFMFFRTVSFSKIKTSKTCTTPIVFSLCYGFKMFWVYTYFIFAKMIDMFSKRDFAFFHFIRHSMCPTYFSISDIYFAVSVRISTNPKPAGFSFDYVIKKLIFHFVPYITERAYAR